MIKLCDRCTEPAEFELDIEEAQELTPRACTDHLGRVARAALDAWEDQGGVICLMRAGG